jgi:GNAT superfamily N-acetyltransferase
MYPIRSLTPLEIGLYREHLLRLDGNDRRLRFGYPMNRDAIERFVASFDPLRDRLFAHFDRRLQVVGAVLVNTDRWATAELAFSVEPGHRGRGLGSALCRRAITWARNRGIRTVSVFCQTENGAMRRLAARAGMAMRTDAGETQGTLALRPWTPVSLVEEACEEQLSILDCILKANRRVLLPEAPSAAIAAP